jgi:hypothetical protein
MPGMNFECICQDSKGRFLGCNGFRGWMMFLLGIRYRDGKINRMLLCKVGRYFVLVNRMIGYVDFWWWFLTKMKLLEMIDIGVRVMLMFFW